MKELKLWRLDINKRVLCIFSVHMYVNGYLGASDEKSDPAIRSRDLDGCTFTTE